MNWDDSSEELRSCTARGTVNSPSVRAVARLRAVVESAAAVAVLAVAVPLVAAAWLLAACWYAVAPGMDEKKPRRDERRGEKGDG